MPCSQVSRFNHDCSPNAHACWNGRLEQETVHAIIDIATGSQISINYFREGSRAARQEHLSREFGFECGCKMCGLVGDALTQSDARQQRISELDDEILSAAEARRPKRPVLAMVKERIRLMEEEGMAPSRAKRTLVDAIQICQAHGDLKGAADWARKARKLVVLSCGEDCLEAEMHDEAIRGAAGYHAGGSAADGAEGRTQLAASLQTGLGV